MPGGSILDFLQQSASGKGKVSPPASKQPAGGKTPAPAPSVGAKPVTHGGMSILSFVEQQQKATTQPTRVSSPMVLQTAPRAVPYTPGAFTVDPFNRTFGIDISYAEETFQPDKSQVPLGFVILKASQGSAPDTKYDMHSLALWNSDIPIKGAYHFLDDKVSVNRQVNTFLNTVADKPYDFYAIDYEPTKSIRATPASAQMARDFIYQVAKITGKPTLLYTQGSLNSQYFNKPGDENLPLWASWPENGPNVLNVSKYITGGKNTPIWQYTYKAPAAQFGINTAEPWMLKPRFYEGKWLPPLAEQGIDANVFNGTVSQMKDYLQGIARMQQTLYGGH